MLDDPPSPGRYDLPFITQKSLPHTNLVFLLVNYYLYRVLRYLLYMRSLQTTFLLRKFNNYNVTRSFRLVL